MRDDLDIETSSKPGEDETDTGDSETGESAPETKEAEALVSALNRSAVRVQTLWFSFLLFMVYLAIAAWTTTHRMLFLEEQLILPVLNIKLPLLGFYILTPFIFVVFHFYMLLSLVLLARTGRSFEDALVRAFPEDVEARENFRMRIENTLFVQLLVGAKREREGTNAWFLSAMALITLALAPVALLLMFEIRFLPYHSEPVSWWHRFLLLADLALVWALWPSYRSCWGNRLWPAWSRRLVPAGVMSLVALAYAVLVATFPDEWIYRKTTWVHGKSHRNLVNGELEWDGRPAWYYWIAFPNVLDLHGESLIGDKLENINKKNKDKPPDKIRWEPVLVLKDRDLTEADLSDTDIRQVAFCNSIFNRANLRHSWIQDARFVLEDAPVQSQDAPLDGATHRHALCRKAQFRGATLNGAQLQGVRLDGARLDGAQLREAHFDGAQLQGATLDGAQLQRASLDKAKLQSASLDYTDLQGASLSSAELQGASFQGAKIEDAQLQGASFNRKTNFQRASLDRAQLQGADLGGVQFQGASLSKTNLQGAFLNGAQLQGARLYSVQLQGALLVGAQLQGARLAGARLQDALLADAHVQGADLIDAHLQWARLDDARLQGASLDGAQLQGASLSGAVLQGASLNYAQLQGALLDSARLEGAWLDGAQLQGASLYGAKLSAAFFGGNCLWRADARNTIFEDVFVQKPKTKAKASPDKDDDCDWTAAKFENFRKLIAEIAPEVDLKHEALERIEKILDPNEKFEGEAEIANDWAKREGEPPSTVAYAVALAKVGCAAEGAPYVVRALLPRLRFPSPGSPFERDSPEVPKLAAAFLDKDCEGARGLSEGEIARLKALAAKAPPPAPKQ